nr:hypothetical protein [Pneumocystis sp. 'macacae']
MKIYQFQNKNLILNSTMKLKESKNITSILSMYFKNYGFISDPCLYVTYDRIKISFFFFSITGEIPTFQMLESVLSKTYSKNVVIEAVGMKYPFLNSRIYAQYIAYNILKKKDPQRGLQKDDLLGLISQVEKKTLKKIGVPIKLSGVNIKISGRLMRNSARTSTEEVSVGILSPFKEKNLFVFKEKNGLNAISVTLYSTP